MKLGRRNSDAVSQHIEFKRLFTNGPMIANHKAQPAAAVPQQAPPLLSVHPETQKNKGGVPAASQSCEGIDVDPVENFEGTSENKAGKLQRRSLGLGGGE